MKKISQAALTKKVKDKNLVISRRKPVKKQPKETAAKAPDPGLKVASKSAEVVVVMANSLADSAEKVSESSVMISQIAQAMQKGLIDVKAAPSKAPADPKKKKWKFTPVRDQNHFIKHITVEEI